MTRARALAAFSLIEVLIAVLILALGLLGLGAIFPVVIRLQRQATDATLGVTAASAASLELENNATLRGEPPVILTGGPAPDVTISPWQVWYNFLMAPARRDELFVPNIRPDTGKLSLGTGATGAIPLGARLFPAAHSSSQPRYVWDFIGQWGGANAINVFVFVRPIDPNIRVRPGRTLSDALAPLNAAGELLDPEVFAVAVDPTSKLPTFSGQGEYSLPVSLDVANVELDDTNKSPKDDRNRLTIDATTAAEKALANFAVKMNQKFVDRFGNIYSVVGTPQDVETGYTVLIQPPLPSDVTNAGDVGPIFFTPQVPAAVTKLKIKL